MAQLLISSRNVSCVFDIVGSKENDISFSLAYVLSNSSLLLQSILKYVTGKTYSLQILINTTIKLQDHQPEKGFTDFELTLPGEFFIVIEAKRGWNLPGMSQLTKYSTRKEFSGAFSDRFIVTLSECADYYIEQYFPTKNIDNIEVRHLSFAKVFSMSKEAAIKASSINEKFILNEFNKYVTKLMTMQQVDSNWVFVVSLGSGYPQGWTISWIDIVEKKRSYFHPVGNRWPLKPLNYIAFRYHGLLQSIHFIKDYVITKNLSSNFQEAPQDMKDHEPHFIYSLAKPIKIPVKVTCGPRVVRSNRVYCMLDTLLTSSTLSEALTESERRIKVLKHL